MILFDRIQIYKFYAFVDFAGYYLILLPASMLYGKFKFLGLHTNRISSTILGSSPVDILKNDILFNAFIRFYNAYAVYQDSINN